MRLLGKALTFDDVLLVPAFSQVLPRDTSLATQLSRNIRLNLPLVSAAMDTVTEARLAIALAQEGGIGIVHKNLTPKQQAAEVARVKRYESGVLRDPITVSPGVPVRDVIALSRQHGISGFPVIEDGRVVGIITGRDLRFETRLDAPVREIMTPRDKLIVVKEGATISEGKALMHQHKLERVLVVNDAFELRGLMTVKDITKQTNFPDAARDAQGEAWHAERRQQNARPGQRTEVPDMIARRGDEIPTRSLDTPFGGVGANINLGSEGVVLEHLFEDGPLAMAGAESGDVIVRIGDELGASLSVDDALAMLRGESGTDVDLTLRSAAGELYELLVTRGTITPPSYEDDTESIE